MSQESTEETPRQAVRSTGFVMCDGYLPDFEGKPVLASCENCQWNMDQSDGPEYGSPWFACENDKKSHMSNLKGFPFKTAQKCCELHFMFMVDWDAESKKQIDT